ncbi:sugar phosphate nucleotidyltransferase [Pseudomonadales bacterium]|nr:sugar phosphate nucleotidyltransferase [Pseudomonadales bacterium]
MNKPIRKAVIPVAGLGTRMLPATKAIPKELLPVYDRPIIEHVVKEAIAAGITEIILVTRSGKEATRITLMRTMSLSTGLRRRAKRPFWARSKTSYPVMSR